MPDSNPTHPAEAPAAVSGWRKSSFSYHADCVTVASLADGGVGVRDSKQPDAGTLSLTREQFAGWVASIKAGQLDDLA